MKMGAKSATTTTKWGQKAPPLKSELKQCGGKKCRQNAKVGAKSAVKTAKWRQKAPPLKSARKKVWWRKVPLKWKSGGGKRHQTSKVMAESATTFQIWWNVNHHISNCGGALTTAYHMQGAGAPAKTKKYKRWWRLYFFGKRSDLFRILQNLWTLF